MTETLIKKSESSNGPAAKASVPKASVAKAWSRALELTASIARHPRRLLPTVIEERATQLAETPALLSDRECLTYRALVER